MESGRGLPHRLAFQGGIGVAVAQALQEIGAEEAGEAAVAFVLRGVDQFVGHDDRLGSEVAAQEVP